jgi:hypothetical protein
MADAGSSLAYPGLSGPGTPVCSCKPAGRPDGASVSSCGIGGIEELWFSAPVDRMLEGRLEQEAGKPKPFLSAPVLILSGRYHKSLSN